MEGRLKVETRRSNMDYVSNNISADCPFTVHIPKTETIHYNKLFLWYKRLDDYVKIRETLEQNIFVAQNIKQTIA